MNPVLRICGQDLHPLVVAFPGNDGTRDMMSIAREAGLEVLEVT